MVIGRTILVFAVISQVSFLVTAHEFWMEGNRFYFKAGETASINFREGENFIGEAWKVRIDRVERLEYYGGKQLKDLKGELKESTDGTFSANRMVRSKRM